MRTIRIQGTGQQISVGKILCLGKNYAEHVKEMNSDIPTTPVIFMKPSTALIENGQDICIPGISHNLHHEVELVAAIGKEGKNISAQKAYEYILGYAIGLDMTLRDIQHEAKDKGLPWTVAKGFDTSAPLSAIIPKAQIPDPQNLTILCKVNGATKQHGSTGNMIFSLPKIIEYISTLFTLEPGDLIFTGTPEGVSQVHNGDRIDAELVGYTSITHTVRAL